MSFEPENLEPSPRDPYAAPSAGDKARLPAIFLIVVAVLNLLGSLYFVANGIFVLTVSPQMFKEQMKQNPLGRFDDVEKGGYTPEQMQKMGGGFYLGLGVLDMLLAILILIAAIQMMRLRGYALAVTGSILAMVPCLSPCCLLGLPLGIWALIVLASPDVKAAFQ